MNKKILLSAVVAGLFSASASTATHFNGWSAGASVQMNNSSADVQAKDYADFGTAKKKGKGIKNTALGLHADWSKTEANNLFYSFGFGVGYNFGNPKKAINKASSKKFELRSKRSYYGEATARLGMAFDRFVAYGLLSLKTTKAKFEILEDSVVTDKGSKQLFAFAPGIGFAYKATNDVSVGFEYKYFMEGKADLKKTADGTKRYEVKNKSHNFGLRVSYHF
jgi:opacity protein-like surface antigen